MKLIAVNRGTQRSIDFNGEQVSTGIFKAPISGPVQISRMGVEGDTIVDGSVHGGVDQAVYLYGTEDYAWWASEIGEDISPGTFGENLTTQGIDFSELVIGDQLKIGDVVLEITAPRTPCFKLATRMADSGFAKKFVRAVRPGAYARVLKEGIVTAGDKIELEKTDQDYAKVVDVFNAWHAKDPDPEFLLKTLQSPIAANHKIRVQEMYDAATKQ